MFYRKVQEVGKGTLLISLPKSWAEKFGVEKGDVLELEVDQFGNLILYPKKRGDVKSWAAVDCRVDILRS